MRPEPFAEVEIIHDDPKQDLRAGQRGYLLDWLPRPAGSEEGALIELHDRVGRNDPTVTVPQSWVRAVVEAPTTSQQPPAKKRRRAPSIELPMWMALPFLPPAWPILRTCRAATSL